MLDLERESNRGHPLTPIQSTCIALNHFAGGHFIRVSANCGNVSYSAAYHAIDRVRNALYRKRKEFICMPTEEEMAATAERMRDKYHLPRFAFGVDGMFVRFDGAPRTIPRGPGYPNRQNFWTRKQFPGINCMVSNINNYRYLTMYVKCHEQHRIQIC
jgi:hypothetical protein